MRPDVSAVALALCVFAFGLILIKSGYIAVGAIFALTGTSAMCLCLYSDQLYVNRKKYGRRRR